MIKDFIVSVALVLLTVGAANGQSQVIDVTAAKKEGRVIVYGSVVPQAMEELHKGFEKKYDIKVEYWRGSSTAVAERAQTEWRAGRPAFDVVESSWDVMILMRKEGLFARYVPPSSEKFPEQFKEKDALITPWRLLPISILFNTELVKAGEAPKNLADLFRSEVEREDQHSRSLATHDDGEISLELGEIHGSKMA
jgi:iron(III) transport system substrate-binding protein